MRFSSVVVLGGKTATGIEVPAEVVDSFNQGKRPRVTVAINGFTYRTTVAVMGGKYWVPLNAENRAAAGVAAGDEIVLDMELDSEPRVVEVPEDFSAALATAPVAAERFRALSYSHQRQHVEAITGAKAAQTREKRIAAALDKLQS